MIKTIEIQYIKGIQNKRFVLDILPNRPSLFVAPNGFGKSSIATAFRSMNNNRIMLNDDDYYAENTSHSPHISIEYVNEYNTTLSLTATDKTNTISNEIDYFVINNQIKPRGISSIYGGRATATLEINDVVLVDRVPNNAHFNYSVQNFRDKFGNNGKVLPNITPAFNCLPLIEKISENFQCLQRANGQRVQEKINSVITTINAQSGTIPVLLKWTEDHLLDNIKQIEYLNTLGNLINQFDIGFTEIESYLAAIQMIWIYNNDTNSFKEACHYNNYRLDREGFAATLRTFNSTWKNIRASETNGQLVVKFPKASHISNGQRDILTFISMLFRAKRHLKKRANILIIDEVFDYLDDANLTAAQYYITTFIKEFASAGKRLYPIILTHLNPNYFKNFAFSDQKVYYLNKSEIEVNQHMIRLIINREDITIQTDVDKYLFHYDPGTISKRAEFRALGIKERWGEANNFHAYVNGEVQNYFNNQPYDPFAICCALRVKIEEIAYSALDGEEARITFLSTKMTRRKLEKARELGVVSPESHFLLGIIYNEGMHWRNNFDNVSPIASKLENLVIKKLIVDVFE